MLATRTTPIFQDLWTLGEKCRLQGKITDEQLQNLGLDWKTVKEFQKAHTIHMEALEELESSENDSDDEENDPDFEDHEDDESEYDEYEDEYEEEYEDEDEDEEFSSPTPAKKKQRK
jgi:hypothetical protein